MRDYLFNFLDRITVVVTPVYKLSLAKINLVKI